MNVTMIRPMHLGAVVLAALAVATAGCGAAGDKAGGKGPTIPLTAAVGEPASAPGAAQQMATYAANVEELSAGGITIELAYGVGGDDFEPGVGSIRDTSVVRLVRDGTYDLAWVPARSWDVEALGVTTLRPLSAPFLVDSNALAAKIATDHVATALMAGLSDLDITGLALLPDGIRYPVGFREPLLGPDDYAGKKVRVPNSATTHALLRALGAEPGDWEGWEQMAKSGAILGAESSLSFLYLYPPGSFVTGNVPLYTKMNTVVMSTASYDRLTDDQRAILLAAAEATVADSIAAIPDESAAAVAACEAGATVVLASEPDLAALHEAAAAVYAELEKDAQTKALIAAIRALKAETPSRDSLNACEPEVAAASPMQSLMPGDPSVLNGTYRMEPSADDFRELGFAEAQIPDWLGIWQVTLTDGAYEWELRQEQATHEPWTANGTYVVSGDRLSAFSDPAIGPPGLNVAVIEDSYRWTLAGETLAVTLVSSNGGPDWGGILSGAWTKLP